MNEKWDERSTWMNEGLRNEAQGGAVVADTLASVILFLVSLREDFSYSVGTHFRVSGCGLGRNSDAKKFVSFRFLARLRKTDQELRRPNSCSVVGVSHILLVGG